MANINPFARNNRRGGGSRARGRGNVPAPFVVPRNSAARPERITEDMFDAGRAHITDSEFLLASFTVPRGEVVALDRLPMRLYLKHHVDFTSTNDASTSEQFDLGAAGVNMIRTTRAAPALPSSEHPDVTAWENDGAGAWTEVNVTAVDFDANTITVAKTANEARTIRVYSTASNGQLRLAAIAPAGSGAIEVQLFNATLGALNEADQAKANAAYVLPAASGAGDIFLSQKFKLGVYIKSTPAMEWSDRAEHEISIPTQRRTITVLDHQGLVRANLAKLGA